MKTSHIVFDTNILLKDHRFSNRDLTKLIKTKKMYDFEICLPQIVYDELVGNFSDDFSLKLSHLAKSIDEINRFTSTRGELDRTEILKKFSKSTLRYKTRLDKFIKDNKIIVLPYSNILHRDVVKKMYDGSPPFKEKNREVGYKDFLISKSISDYFKNNIPPGKILFLTENVKDFIDPSESSKEGILQFAQEFQSDRLAIAPSYTVLFKELSRNLNEKYKNLEIFKNNEEISKKIKSVLDSDFQIFEFDIFKNLMLDMKIKNMHCQVIEYATEFNDEAEIMEVSGILKLEMDCSFTMDDWDLRNISSRDFVFLKNIKRFMEDNGFSRRDEWSNEFRDIKYSSEFFFNYIDFDFELNKLKKEYEFDSYFLSLSKI
jgi:hypothetical protein